MSPGFHASGGWIEVIAGVMFSGKTEELLRRVRRATIARKQVQLFKSHLDDRYGDVWRVASHDQHWSAATPVDSAAQLAQRVKATANVIAIDEAQFLDVGIVAVCTALAERGQRVIVAGTDTDFRGEPFGAMPQLMAVAEEVDKLHAICVVCGASASRNQRLINGIPAPFDSPTIMVGAADSYEARCRACHEVPRRDASQQALFHAPGLDTAPRDEPA